MAIDELRSDGRGPSASGPDPGQALCAAFIDELPVAGASISIVTETGTHSIVGASDVLAAELEAWQFSLGVGPHWEALRTERPAFLYDTALDALQDAWPALAVDGVPAGAGALYAIPLQLGAATVGVADLYSRSATDPWSDDVVDLACGVAVGVTARAVRLATRSAEAPESATGRNAIELRREVHQATGMVMSQLGCTAGTALLRLRAHAFASGTSLDAVARQVITRQLHFIDQ